MNSYILIILHINDNRRLAVHHVRVNSGLVFYE